MKKMQDLIVEIRAAEGGNDAKLLVDDQANIYARLSERHSLIWEFLECRPGIVVARVQGKKAGKTFINEVGGHRWQRIPPTEKRDRVHTSTITVAVLPIPKAIDVLIPESDLEEFTCRGSGSGGQHRNMTDSAVQIRHKPTGITVRAENERSQHQNREVARAILRARLQQIKQETANNTRSEERRKQVGSGMRGDKRRTIRVRDDYVVDHITGQHWRFSNYVKGNW